MCFEYETVEEARNASACVRKFINRKNLTSVKTILRNKKVYVERII